MFEEFGSLIESDKKSNFNISLMIENEYDLIEDMHDDFVDIQSTDKLKKS